MKTNNSKKIKALLSIVLFAGLLITACQKSPTSAIDEPEVNAVSELSSKKTANSVVTNTSSSSGGTIIIDSFDQGQQAVGPLTGFFASQRTGRDLYEGAGPIGDRRELAGSENSPGTVNLSISGSAPGEMVAAYSGSSTHSSLIDLRYGSCSDPILSGQKRSIVWGEVTCDPSTHQLNLDLSGLTSFEIDFTNMQGGSKWAAGIYLSSGTGNNFFYREVEIPFQQTSFTHTISASDFSGITETDLADIDGIIVTMGNNGNVASGGNVTISEVRANVESAEPVTNVYISDSSVDTYDPIFPSSADPNWVTTVCYQENDFGLTANWVNPHKAYEVGTHPWENGTVDAKWINSYNSIDSRGPGGHNWSKYETNVSGNGDFVVQLIADNCSWVYLSEPDGSNPELVGYQATSSPGQFSLGLDGDHKLTFVIFDGGGLAGGKFRLETTESFGGTPPPPIEPTNTAPVADAGSDISKDATGSATPVTLDGLGSSDPDGDALTYSWSDGSSVVSTDASFTANLADGDYTFTLTVSDGELTDSDEVSVSVVNTIPVLAAIEDVTKEATGPTTPVTLTGSATDADGDQLTYTWSNGETGQSLTVDQGVGSVTYTLTVTDEQGATDTENVTVTIKDTMAPELSFSQETNSLWPPNHKMVLVATGISAIDIVDGITAVDVTVSSSEPFNGKGDGNTASDYEVVNMPDGTIDVYVRAERSGQRNGRTYTIEMTTTDVAGNIATSSMEVSVAKSQGRRGR
ncbi:PKD domain-containing protein [Gracilimonas sp.]|uniref:PKD domain-containing protein n=1 Tax=Gracilimonas sp. TaxID=1974203 RepID=UPI003BA881D3